jgi:hypothetical protein
VYGFRLEEYSNTEYLSTPKSLDSPDPPLEENLNTRNRVYEYLTGVVQPQPRPTTQTTPEINKTDTPHLDIPLLTKRASDLKKYLNTVFIYCSIEILYLDTGIHMPEKTRQAL